MKKFIILCVIGATLFTYCTTDTVVIPKKEPVSPRTCDHDLSTQETIDIGDFHNEFLDVLMGELNCLDIDESLADAVGSIIRENEVPNASTVISWIINNSADGFDISTASSSFSEFSEVEDYYNDIIAAIEASTSYSGLTSDLSTIKGAATSNLTCMDLDFILTCAEVAAKSAYYWMPTSIGGLGNENPCSQGAPRVPWWKRAIIGDVEGLAGACIGIGIGGMITAAAIPGTNLALGVALGTAAAFGSAMGVAHGE